MAFHGCPGARAPQNGKGDVAEEGAIAFTMDPLLATGHSYESRRHLPAHGDDDAFNTVTAPNTRNKLATIDGQV